MNDPAIMRRIVFATEEEFTSVREDLDQLLASAWQLQHFVETTLPVCRERSLALTKLEEFLMWARLAALHKADEKRETPA